MWRLVTGDRCLAYLLADACQQAGAFVLLKYTDTKSHKKIEKQTKTGALSVVLSVCLSCKHTAHKENPIIISREFIKSTATLIQGLDLSNLAS